MYNWIENLYFLSVFCSLKTKIFFCFRRKSRKNAEKKHYFSAFNVLKKESKKRHFWSLKKLFLVVIINRETDYNLGARFTLFLKKLNGLNLSANHIREKPFPSRFRMVILQDFFQNLAR